MKKLVLSLIVIAAFIMSQAAFADSRNYRRGYSGYGGYGYGNRYSYRSNYYGRYSPYRYGSYGRRGRTFGSHRYRRSDAGSFIGGLFLGSMLSYPSYTYAPRRSTVIYRNAPVGSRNPVNVVRYSSSPALAVPGRHLLRDLQGNCFEINVDDEGNEIRVQLEAEACNF
ncbi:MAG: hypothetical protein QGG67_04390 [Gammaproteobacteria bacterium]|jgi:hypothetical protein|nr:hypothetical protein [Gammaproteobacteria bacterium]MDP6095220.1 hypothetical protein [Gammaproteobacteria bacterium]MDP7455387.1 hypothetical protein [Gammaproteobacteria bacterium]HJO10762.1 hypothetical protein [Gammaproteobacteria bacterium]|tara:strand:- start:4372 stop:4875 length:504 start_codon:yes stop_codon:yes gene_type:complete